MQNSQSFATAMQRRLLLEAGNLPALSGNDAKPSDTANSKETQGPVDVLSLGTGSFPAFSNAYGQMLMPLLPEAIEATTLQATEGTQTTGDKLSGAKYKKWAYLITIPAAILLSLVFALILVWRKRGRAPIAPWKTGLSGPLQKALVTGNFSSIALNYLILQLRKLMHPKCSVYCIHLFLGIQTFYWLNRQMANSGTLIVY